MSRMSYRRGETSDARFADRLGKTEGLTAASSIRFRPLIHVA